MEITDMRKTNLLEKAITLTSHAEEQMALYCYLSKCCTLTAKEVRDTYSNEICNKTCCMDLYAKLIVEHNSVEELASLFLKGEEVYSSIVTELFSAPGAFAM